MSATTEIYDWAQEKRNPEYGYIKVVEPEREAVELEPLEVVVIESDETPAAPANVSRGRSYAGDVFSIAAVGVAAAAAIVWVTGGLKGEALPDGTAAPATLAPADPATTTPAPLPLEEFRYDYENTAVVCGIVPETHTVRVGETIYSVTVDAFPTASESDMHFLFPAMKALNIERKKVEDPNELQIDDEVLVLADCRINSWWRYLDSDDIEHGGVYVSDITHDALLGYDYDYNTDTWGELQTCFGNDEYCESIGYVDPYATDES